MGNRGTLWQDCFLGSAQAIWDTVTAQVAGNGQSSVRQQGGVPCALAGLWLSACGEGGFSRRRDGVWTVSTSSHPVNLCKRQLHLLAGRAELLDCWQRVMLLSLLPSEGG